MREQINQSNAVAPAHALINRLRSFAEQATPEGRLDPGQPPLSSDVLTGMPVMLAGASVTAADVSALPVVTDIEASGPGVPFARPVEPAPTTEIPRLVPEGGAVEAKPAALPPGREAAAASADREVLARVDAELLDDMLNSAGEVSIFRARLEQQFSSVESNLGELGRVVLRLKDQMR